MSQVTTGFIESPQELHTYAPGAIKERNAFFFDTERLEKYIAERDADGQLPWKHEKSRGSFGHIVDPVDMFNKGML